MNRPRWVCRDKKDQDRLEQWTMEQLYPPHAGPPSETEMYLADPELCAPLEHEYGQQLLAGRVLVAAQRKDVVTLARLIAAHPELAPLVNKKRGPGRPTEDHSVYEAIWDDVERIRDVWSRPPPLGYGFRNRKVAPTAVGIAARAWGIEPDELARWRANHPKKSPS